MLRGNKVVTCCGPNNAVSLDPLSLGESAPYMQFIQVIFARICSLFPKIRIRNELSSLNHPPFQDISSNVVAAHSTPPLFFFCRQYTFNVRVHCFHMSFFLTIWRQSTRGDWFSCSDCFHVQKALASKKLFLRLYDLFFFL